MPFAPSAQPKPAAAKPPPRAQWVAAPGKPAATAALPVRAPTAGWGYDVSWPQCDGALPPVPFDTAVVGATDGRPFTHNPCLRAEAEWARGARFQHGNVQLYINLELDGSPTGPRPCADNDHPCRAYNYGARSVDDAVAYASSAGISPSAWWLDVEIGNNWSDTNIDWNAAVVQGAIDELRSKGFAPGVYSSADQWEPIVGGFRPKANTWLAVVGSQATAPGFCTASLTDGPVLMVQYDDHGFDSDFACPTGVADLITIPDPVRNAR
jgi:hypothetical protein